MHENAFHYHSCFTTPPLLRPSSIAIRELLFLEKLEKNAYSNYVRISKNDDFRRGLVGDTAVEEYVLC